MANSNTLFTPDQMRDTQGLVISGYAKMPFCTYYLLLIKDANKVKPWLNKLVAERITAGEPDDKKRKTTDALNLAITKEGFKELGVGIDSFEQAFQDGMQTDSRATILGDFGDNHYSKWQWGNDQKPVHFLLMLYSADEQTHAKRQKEEEAAFKQGGLVLATDKRLDTTNMDEEGRFEKEHFGFADGVSQPLVAGMTSKTASEVPQAPQIIPTGEFVLGYPNGYDGNVTAVPGDASKQDPDKIGFNGTYLVFRQMEQDVPAFWEFINTEAKKQKIDADYLAAKIVGRWKNGAILQPGESKAPVIKDKDTDLNGFDYRDDLEGKGCPFGSHVRRTNPRGQGLGVEQNDPNESIKTSLKVANRHRILRRGRSYGNFLNDPLKDDAKGERGLFFICLNSNIERQFEFIQHTWVNNLKFNGLYDEDDPLIGTYGSSDPSFKRSFTIQDDPLRRRICNFQQFITIKGGSYFFLPGIKALRMLAD
jgi:Dyp-type peroxidase family